MNEFEVNGEDGLDPLDVLDDAAEMFFDGEDVFIKFQSESDYDHYRDHWTFLLEPSVTVTW